ncbi:MAG TPA: pantetheine-phosphate adenylyltransferase [Longimicrobiales bacterium]|jgi:pantetheine-phosphate adenylyltransferase|nr:pantetheine-phosphate adenylyltransferase [Longimicrobiales bacterium]
MPEPRTAIYPGSFDPITNGHEDIVRRALEFTDQVIVAVAHSATHAKRGLLDISERVELIRSVLGDESRVEVAEFRGLLVDFARSRGARLVIRGLRAVSDFEYEFQMALMNRHLDADIETVFLAPDSRYTYLSASLVREIAALGGDVSDFVAPPVLRKLEERLGG